MMSGDLLYIGRRIFQNELNGNHDTTMIWSRDLVVRCRNDEDG